MVIDFHTHLFPEKIAAKAIQKLEEGIVRTQGSAVLTANTDGTRDGLINSMNKYGVDMSIVMPIATTPTQHRTINNFAKEVTDNKRIISFGSLHPMQEDWEETLCYIAEEGFKDQNGTGRIYIWKVALKNAPKYLLTGIGIDQFFYINDGKIIYDPITGNAIDKAHNEYLQILLTEGIFKCITYIVFLLWIFFKGVYVIIKSKKIDPLLLGLFLSFTAYCVQAFFNISVTRVAPIFFIIGGLLLAQLEKKQEEFSN